MVARRGYRPFIVWIVPEGSRTRPGAHGHSSLSGSKEVGKLMYCACSGRDSGGLQQTDWDFDGRFSGQLAVSENADRGYSSIFNAASLSGGSGLRCQKSGRMRSWLLAALLPMRSASRLLSEGRLSGIGVQKEQHVSGHQYSHPALASVGESCRAGVGSLWPII
jgi:hypothetical protein